MDSEVSFTVYDLGTADGREAFFSANPWMRNDKWLTELLNRSKSNTQVK